MSPHISAHGRTARCGRTLRWNNAALMLALHDVLLRGDHLAHAVRTSASSGDATLEAISSDCFESYLVGVPESVMDWRDDIRVTARLGCMTAQTIHHAMQPQQATPSKASSGTVLASSVAHVLDPMTFNGVGATQEVVQKGAGLPELDRNTEVEDQTCQRRRDECMAEDICQVADEQRPERQPLLVADRPQAERQDEDGRAPPSPEDNFAAVIDDIRDMLGELSSNSQRRAVPNQAEQHDHHPSPADTFAELQPEGPTRTVEACTLLFEELGLEATSSMNPDFHEPYERKVAHPMQALALHWFSQALAL
eukprot:CAMPEP_0183399734 /NCGR_PEP_ID=MMETSP0370-20130417/12133_1 /TAXON_ID=268820 /ORGANISM="Peridinium aciculiferum, Strain PAER-2" /LENGTH=308 /DNA_ID=CAMNT_0025580935 /DNA_START=170 /DNA_END=1096 /DNA_ORIENTATION=-